MARRYYSSTAARTTLAADINSSVTTVGVNAVTGWPGSFPYTLIIDQDTVNEEIVEVTARSGTTLTVVRGVDGSTAIAHTAGAAVNHGVSARDFNEPNEFINTPNVLGVNARTASYTLVTTDNNKIVQMSSTSATTITVPTNAAQPFPVGSTVRVQNMNTGAVTIGNSGGVTVNALGGYKI